MKTLKVNLISGQLLKYSKSNISSKQKYDKQMNQTKHIKSNPQITIQLVDDKPDGEKQKYQSQKKTSGYNPIFNEDFEFKYYDPMFSFLIVKVWNASSLMNDMIGQCCINIRYFK